MAANFAPYQSAEPESARVSSPHRASSAPPPPSANPAPQPQPHRAISSIAAHQDPWAAARGTAALPSPSAFASQNYDDLEGGGLVAGAGHGWRSDAGAVAGGTDVFSTSLGLRMEVEAGLAFHAWQSSLVFSAAFVVHLVLSWSSVLSWLLFVGDVVLIAYLTFRAYRDAETLDRCELPFFGALASRFVDDE
ncbi:hypothetical protein H2203_007780 [Taxawa tesnikishii (nom. ined.)]|nr:hypothetical protein H2203_007780 [Dothideales sp. JES 119]